MKVPKRMKWLIAVLMVVAAVPMVGNALLGGTQARCVGVDTNGEGVKAMGSECDRLDQVVIIELGNDGQVQVSGAESVEFGP